MSNETPEPVVNAVEVSAPGDSIWAAPPVVTVVAPPGASSNSIVALVLSICSWVVFPIVFAVIALVFASKAEKEIAASNGSVGGGAFVTASKIVSWINIGFYAALAILGLLALLLFTILEVSGNYSS